LTFSCIGGVLNWLVGEGWICQICFRKFFVFSGEARIRVRVVFLWVDVLILIDLELVSEEVLRGEIHPTLLFKDAKRANIILVELLGV
jgi:hypothetical protein